MSYTNGLDNPELYFQCKLYTGNGSTQAITFDGSENMQPDFIWCKSRNNVRHHYLADVIRGVKGRLRSDANNAEYTANSTSGFDSFDSDGFTLEEDSSSLGLNESGHTMVSWNWKAGGSASSNSNGSITSSVSANTTAGFSIVSYTGTGSATTVGHGLGSAPACYIIKQRNTTGGWIVYHKGNTSSPETDYLRLDKTDSTVDDAIFNDTAPTSSVFSIGTNAPVNTSSGTYIAYCFAEKKGYSKFGSYTGNGAADGNFIYTGFRPAFILLKNTGNGSAEWRIYDNKRDSSNVMTKCLQPHSTDAEETTSNIDFLSNGWKVRSNDGNLNQSGYSFIYMAFAESPFVTSTGIPTTAR